MKKKYFKTTPQLCITILCFLFNLNTTAQNPVFVAQPDNPFGLTDIGTNSNPTFIDIDNDGDLDCFVGEQFGNFKFFENTGTATVPVFTTVVTNPFGLADIGIYNAPTFIDIDNDGDLDCFAGEQDGHFNYFENIGTATTPVFAAAVSNPFGFSYNGLYCTPIFIDIDNDGDFDCFAGIESGNFSYYENKGTSTFPDFSIPSGYVSPITNPFGLTDIGNRSAPTFIDIDNDGDLDCIAGEQYGNFKYFENTGTATSPVFATAIHNPFGLAGIGTYSSPTFIDIDNDGDVDCFSGENFGNFKFFKQEATPTVSTTAATNITSSKATLAGNATADGGYNITERGVVYSVTTSNGDPLIGGTGTIKNPNGTGTGVFSEDITGLLAATQYSFKAYAISAIGTSYGTIQTFTTLSAVSPTVSTIIASNITPTTTRLAGNVIDGGGATITERGIVYAVTATNTNPLINGTGVTKNTNGTGIGSFTKIITSLTANTNYSYKAYAINSIGTSYGTTQTFTTLPAGAYTPVFVAQPNNPFGLTNTGGYSTPTFIDIDNDGDLDCFAGNSSGDFKYFENTGTTVAPTFPTAVTNPFGLTDIGFKNTPTFIDIDNDGDLDCFTGESYGSFQYFENIGTATAPIFAATVTNPFGLTDIGNRSTPTFIDIDNDGDLDCFTGESSGNFKYFENTGTATIPIFAAAVTNPFGLTDIGDYSSPTFIDIDNDGDVDCIAGEKYGNFKFFENTGTAASPTFTAVATNPFGLADIGFYSTPIFIDIDNDGDLECFSGEQNGNFKYFKQGIIPTVTTTAATNITSSKATLAGNATADGGNTITERGIVYSVTTTNGDPLIGGTGTIKNTNGTGTGVFSENITGLLAATQYSFKAYAINTTGISYGTVQTFTTLSAVSPTVNTITATNITSTTTRLAGNVIDNGGTTITERGIVYAITATNTDPLINGTGVIKNTNGTGTGGFTKIITGLTANTNYSYKAYAINSLGTSYGTTQTFTTLPAGAYTPVFVAQPDNPFGLASIGGYSTPTFIDIDNDGDLDCFAGNSSGDFKYFENTGTSNAPTFSTAVTNPFGLTDIGYNNAHTFIDIDNDGDLDCFAGGQNGNFNFFENIGTATTPLFAAAITNPFGLTYIGNNNTPTFIDIDNDGDLDCFAGEQLGNFKYFENTGTADAPTFIAIVNNPFGLADIGNRSNPTFIDIDNDGDLDCFAGESYGNFKYFENTGTVTSPAFITTVTTNPFSLTDIGSYCTPTFIDIDNDGDLDCFSGESLGNFKFFKQILTPTIIFTDIDKTYGDANITLGATTNSTGTISYSIIGNANGTSLSGTNNATLTIGNTGTLTIRATVAADGNYDSATKDITLTITKAILTATADNKNKVYGAINPSFTITYTGFKNSDTLVVLDTAPTASSTATTGTGVGTVAITLSAGTDNNYTITTINGILTITQKSIIIAAEAKTKTYGDSDPSLTYTVSPSLLGPDTLTGSLSRTTGEDVGTYAISSTLANSNYNITFVSADVTITQKDITITADDITKPEGATDPALTYSITTGSLVNSDAFSGNLSRVAGEAVGTYAIEQGSVTAGNNYNLSFVSGIFTITSTAGIEDTLLSKSIKMYPNPVKDIFNIEVNNQITVKEVLIYSVLGKVIYREKNTTKFSIGTLPEGVYLVKVITNKGIGFKRIVKK